MNWQDLIHENRKLIRNGALFIVVLIIILIGLIIANQIIDSKEKYIDNVNNNQEQNSFSVNEMDPSANLDELHTVIKEKYKEKLDGYQIADGKLLDDGSWYITTIAIPQKSQWDLATDTYRIILHQDVTKWQIVAEPSLVFSYSDYQNIPQEIIFSANNL